MHRRHLLLASGFFLLLIVTTPPLFAQSNTDTMRTIHIGDPLVDGSFIQPSRQQYLLVITDSEGKETHRSTWDYVIEIVEEGGRTRLVRKLKGLNEDGSLVRTQATVVDHKTLAPISWEFDLPGVAASNATFEGKAMTVAVRQPGSETPQMVNFLFEHAVFDYPNLHGVQLLGFPFEAGFSARYPTYAQEGAGLSLVWQEVHVKRKGRVNSGTRSNVEAWEVETAGGWIYWLSKDAPYIIKVVAPDPGGGQRLFTLLDS